MTAKEIKASKFPSIEILKNCALVPSGIESQLAAVPDQLRICNKIPSTTNRVTFFT